MTASGTGTFPLELRVLRKYVLLCCGLVFISGNVRGLCREGPVVLTEGFTPNCCNDTIGTSHSSFHPGGIESEHANETRTNSIQGRYCLFTKKELALIPKSGSGSFGSFPSYLMLLGHGLGSWSEEGNLKVAPRFVFRDLRESVYPDGFFSQVSLIIQVEYGDVGFKPRAELWAARYALLPVAIVSFTC